LTIDILPHLAELEKRELYVGYGYGSLLDYCISHAGYSESSAGRRVRASRVVGDVPEVYDLLKDEKFTFGGVLLLSGALRPDNKTELLPRVIGKTHGQIERIVAEYKPPKRIPDQARPTLVIKPVERAPSDEAGASLGVRKVEPSPEALALGENEELGDLTRHGDGSNPPLPAVELERMYDIRFAGDEELMKLMRWMKTYLSGRYPKGASYLEMIKYAISYVREREDLEKRAERRKHKEKREKRNKKQQQRAKATSTAPESRHIPSREREAVRIRDEGPGGKRCSSTHNLQYDHYPIPFARGGPSTADNLRLLCAKHNRYTAEKIFGKRDYNKQPVAGT
jgi:hypothetical protein